MGESVSTGTVRISLVVVMTTSAVASGPVERCAGSVLIHPGRKPSTVSGIQTRLCVSEFQVEPSERAMS